MKKVYLKDLLTPKKIINLPSGIKIHLEGMSQKQEDYVESIRGNLMIDLIKGKVDREKVDKDTAIYVHRMIRCCVKKIEGVIIVDENDNETPFVLEFEEDEMTLESYVKLMKVLKDEEVVQEIITFYADSTKNELLKGIDFKKKMEVQST